MGARRVFAKLPQVEFTKEAEAGPTIPGCEKPRVEVVL